MSLNVELYQMQSNSLSLLLILYEGTFASSFQALVHLDFVLLQTAVQRKNTYLQNNKNGSRVW